MITVVCPSCLRIHQAPEVVLGKRAQCKDCGATFLVKPTVPSPPETRDGGQHGQLKSPAEKPAPPPSDETTRLHLALPATIAKRPFGLVWVVFYWIISGAVGMAYGIVLCIMAGLGGSVSSELSRGLGSLAREPARGIALFEFVGLLGLLLFHYGLLLLVAGYGLWTNRRWGLVLARPLAIASVVLGAIALTSCIMNRAVIVASAVNLIVSVRILLYLYGHSSLPGLFRRFLPGPSAREDRQ